MAAEKSNNQLLPYSALAFPLAFAGIPLYMHIPDLYSKQAGMSLSAVGIILVISRLLDAFIDPYIGIISDRFSRFRKNIISYSAIILCFSFLLLFNPVHDPALISLWFFAFILLGTIAFSVLTINYNTIASIWADSDSHATKITTTREAIGITGLIVAVILPTVLTETFNITDAYLYYSLIFVIITGVCLFLFTKCNISTNSDPAKPFTFKSLYEIFKNNRSIFLIYFISYLASSIPAVLVLFFIRERIGAEKYSGLFLMIYFISAALTMPLWKKLADRTSILSAWATAMFLAVASFVWAFFIGYGDVIAYALICVFSGIAFSAELSLPQAFIATAIKKQNRIELSSSYFAIMAFIMKLCLALAAGVTMPALDMFGFKPNLVNSDSALLALSVFYALIPCCLKLIAFIGLFTHIKNHGAIYEKNNLNNFNDNGGKYVL